MVLGFKDANGDFRPTEKYLPVLHSSMLFPESRPTSMNDQKRNHLYSFAKKSLFSAGKSYGVTKGITKIGVDKIRDERNKNIQKRNERIAGINEAVSVIAEDSEMSPNEKISQLQRILNTSHKDMDNALHSRIKLELQSLHKLNEKKQSARKPKPQNQGVTFANMYEDDDQIPNSPDVSEPINTDYESDTQDKPEHLTAQELASLSAIQSEVS